MKVSGIHIDTVSTNLMIQELNNIENRLTAALQIVSDTAAKKMADWAKENKPWETRTGHAVEQLSGNAYWQNKDILVTAVMHNVDYGIWLELAHEKKYAVLEKAIESERLNLIAQYVKLLGV